ATHPASAPAVVPSARALSSRWAQIADDLRAAIACGALQPGDAMPPVSDLSARYRVAPSTAHQAIAALAATGTVAVGRGRRATVLQTAFDGARCVSALPRSWRL